MSLIALVITQGVYPEGVYLALFPFRLLCDETDCLLLRNLLLLLRHRPRMLHMLHSQPLKSFLVPSAAISIAPLVASGDIVRDNWPTNRDHPHHCMSANLLRFGILAGYKDRIVKIFQASLPCTMPKPIQSIMTAQSSEAKVSQCRVVCPFARCRCN
jgi:hypothetical protein